MIWLELLLAFLVLGWGVYQLVDLRREKKKDAARAASRSPGPGRAAD